MYSKTLDAKMRSSYDADAFGNKSKYAGRHLFQERLTLVKNCPLFPSPRFFPLEFSFFPSIFCKDLKTFDLWKKKKKSKISNQGVSDIFFMTIEVSLIDELILAVL